MQPSPEFSLDLIPGNIKNAMSEAGATSRDLWQVPVEHLRLIEGFNVRTRDASLNAHVETLTNSILENGFYQHKPLEGFVANEDGVQVIHLTGGHCRLEAAQAAIKRGAEIRVLPVVVSPKGTSMEDLTIGLATSNSGRPFSPYEMGMVCKRLTGFGWEVSAIGKKLSLTAGYVEDLLSLVAAPKPIRDMVIGGKVSCTTAISEVKKHGAGAQARLERGLETAASKGKTRVTKSVLNGPKPNNGKANIDKGEGLGLRAAKALLAWVDLMDEGTEDQSKFDHAVDLARKALAASAPLS